MADSTVDPPHPGLREIFLAFLEIALTGFGGALPWVRRTLVERRGWVNEREFAELLGLCQVLPGGNGLNIAISVGARFGGVAGAVVAYFGLMLAPLLIVCLLGVLYSSLGQVDQVRTALRGSAVVAVGLLLTTGVRLATPYRRQPWAIGVAALMFVAAGILRLPLIPVLLVMAPLGILLAVRGRL